MGGEPLYVPIALPYEQAVHVEMACRVILESGQLVGEGDSILREAVDTIAIAAAGAFGERSRLPHPDTMEEEG